MEGSLVAYKVFTNGSVLNASEMNEYLMNQSVITFSNSTARGSAITTPVEGMITYLEDTQTYESWDGTAWVALITPASSGNAIINGGFDIWQRGTTFTNMTNTSFAADRWRVNTADGLIDVSRSTFTLGAAPLDGLDGKFFATVSPAATDLDPRFTQPIERVETFAGQTVTVSFYAKSTITTDAIRFVRLRQSFGTGGSPSANVDTDSSAITLTSSWARYTATITLPSITGKTLGTAGDDRLEVSICPKASTAQTLDIWGVQIEAGSTATPFRRNANSLQGELAACQRYYVRLTNQGLYAIQARGWGISSTQASLSSTLPVQMRAAPTSVEFGTVEIADSVNAGLAVTALILEGPLLSNRYAATTATVASGATQFRPYNLRNAANTAGFLGFSAEL